MGIQTSLFEKIKGQAHKLRAETYALYLAYRDPRTPWYAKAWAGLVLAYAFSPLDLIPDPIPVLGYLDDLILLPLGIALVLRLIPAPVMAECRVKAQGRLDSGQPVNWSAAAVIVCIWIALAVIAIRLIVR